MKAHGETTIEGARGGDVIVVGAGFCGLSAALALKNRGFSVLLLEARNRVGGRVEAIVNGLGETVDVGGQYFCTDMMEVTALASSRGLDLVDGLHDGEIVVIGASEEAGDPASGRSSSSLRERVRALDIDDPEIAGLSVLDWLAEQPDDDGAKVAFRSMVEGLWCQPAGRLPLWYLASNDRRITNSVPELQYYPAATMQALAQAMADDLGPNVHLGEPVSTITRHVDRIIVQTGRAAYGARHVIVAVPPVKAREIAYLPPLPSDLSEALDVWESGKAIKTLLRYEKVFWRESGLSGMVASRHLPGFFACDASRDDRHASLVVFVAGALCVDLRRKGLAAVKDFILSTLSEALGPQAAAPLDMIMRDWTDDPWSGGAYADTIMDMQPNDAEAVLRRGAPRITFGCSELALNFPCYVEGAIQAGHLAAENVATMLFDASALT